jgi:hypothetical protein
MKELDAFMQGAGFAARLSGAIGYERPISAPAIRSPSASARSPYGIINSKWHSIYPTAAHERAGKVAELPAEKVEAILSGLPASFSDTREQVVYEMAMCLANSRWVPKRLYDRAVDALGHAGVTDVICLAFTPVFR